MHANSGLWVPIRAEVPEEVEHIPPATIQPTTSVWPWHQCLFSKEMKSNYTQIRTGEREGQSW